MLLDRNVPLVNFGECLSISCLYSGLIRRCVHWLDSARSVTMASGISKRHSENIIEDVAREFICVVYQICRGFVFLQL